MSVEQFIQTQQMELVELRRLRMTARGAEAKRLAKHIKEIETALAKIRRGLSKRESAT